MVVAASSTWNAGSGAWSASNNWLNGIPDSTTSAIIDNDGTAQLASGVSGTADTINLGVTSGGSGAVVISGGVLSNIDGYIGAHAGSNGSMTVRSGTWANSGSLYLGNAGTGRLLVNGGYVSVGAGIVSGYVDGSSGSITVSSGTLSTVGDLTTGFSSTGSLLLSRGSILTNSDANIGYNAGSNGSATASSGTWAIRGRLAVGLSGTGSLLVNGGYVASRDNVVVGDMNGSNGSIIVSKGQLSTYSNMIIGVSSTGSLLITGGEASSFWGSIIGSDAGSNGTVTVNGGIWANVALLEVGRMGAGSLLINGGMVHSSESGYIGSKVGSSGVMTVTGGTWNTQGATIGAEGTGTLNLTGKGVVMVVAGSGTVHMGSDAGSAGTLNIGTGGAAGKLMAAEVTGGAGQAVVNFNHTGKLVFASKLANSIVVNKLAAGTTILTGSNTYAAGTTITAGTLQLGNGGTTGMISGAITNNATLAIKRSNLFVFSSSISGAGRLVQAGTGTTVLTADSTSTGGATISAGALQFGNGGTHGFLDGAITISSKAALILNRSNAMTIGAAVNGGGRLIQAGSGTSILTGQNSHTGGTTISAGALQIGDGGTTGAISGAITNNSMLIFNRSNAMALGSAISGSGQIVQFGSGATTLTGKNTSTGGTTVAGGVLGVGSNTALGNGDVTLTGGTLATNGKINRINVNGDLLWDSDARIALTLRSSKASELVVVTGGLSLIDDSPVTFVFTPVDLPAGHINFKVMTVAGGFGGITADDFTFTSGDPGLEGTFRIMGNELWFDDGYEPSSTVALSSPDSPMIVPEPSVSLLMAVGLVFLVGMRNNVSGRFRLPPGPESAPQG